MIGVEIQFYYFATVDRSCNNNSTVTSQWARCCVILDCLPKHLSRHRSKKTSKLCVTGLCGGNPPVKYEEFHSEKCIWKCLHQNGGHLSRPQCVNNWKYKHDKANHNKTACIFYGIYGSPWWYLSYIFYNVFHIWGVLCQKQVPGAETNNHIPFFTVGCNYLSGM